MWPFNKKKKPVEVKPTVQEAPKEITWTAITELTVVNNNNICMQYTYTSKNDFGIDWDLNSDKLRIVQYLDRHPSYYNDKEIIAIFATPEYSKGFSVVNVKRRDFTKIFE